MLIHFTVAAQQLQCRVIDSETGQPLSYATILLNHQSRVVYTDSTGLFFLNKDSLHTGDSICVIYLGFEKFCVAVDSLTGKNRFLLVSERNELNPVTVSNCQKFRNYLINRRTGSIDNYLGPGPETKIIIIGRYPGKNNREGYIRQLRIYAGTFNGKARVPVRLRWYQWDAAHGMPGKELTSRNILLYPYQKGWNSFPLPADAIYFPPEGIVFGLEFIYPMEFVQEYTRLVTTREKADWLMQMEHRWSLGMQTVRDNTQRGFYIINNDGVMAYASRGNNYFIKPAIKFMIARCEK